MNKNSIYLSAPEVYTAIIENKDGQVMFTKKMNEFSNALEWCKGMARTEEGFAYKLTDTDTKKVLASGRHVNGEIGEYEKGINVELEHRDLIIEMLTKAGQEPTEEKIKAIAREIASVHIKEDPQYYEKLEKVGL